MPSRPEDYRPDETDRRILRILQHDGRITNHDLARQAGLSPASCFERVKRLRAQGIIQGVAALLDPSRLDYAQMVFIEISLDRTTENVFAAFAEHVRGVAEVLECHMVAGGFDYLLKVRVSDMTAYRAFLGGILAAMPGVRETRTYPVLEEVKHSTRLPI